MAEDYIVELKGICKRFGGINALKDVDLELRRGEIMGIVGDNGAGKSTLMKILSGAYVADEGEIWVNGKKAHIRNPQDSTDLGIGMIYQDLALFNNFDVAKNIFVGREYTRGPLHLLLDKKRMYTKAEELIRDLRVDIKSPRQNVMTMSGGQRQMVACARAIAFESKILIMDEPTAALGVTEANKLLSLIRNLADGGLSILLITQRIPDILAIANRVFILKGGMRQGILNVGEVTLDDVVTLIVRGRDRAEAARLMSSTSRSGELPKRPDQGKVPMTQERQTPGEAPEAPVQPQTGGPAEASGWKVDLGVLRKYAVLFVLLGLIVLFSIANPQFLTVRNLTNIVTQNTYFIIVAIGLAFVLISGGIDLSVGYQMSLVGVIMAMMMTEWGLPVWLALLTAIVLGTMLGLINGLIVTRIRTFPLIVTLATAVIFQGISYIVSQARTFRDYPESFQAITKARLFGIPFDVYLTIVIVILVSIVFYQTKWGTRVVALGGNEEALRLAGVGTRRLKTLVYTTCGFFTAIATIVMVSKANSMQSSFGPGTEFTALTAAIVGGVSFLGGEGNIPALVAGVFVLAVLGNGMQLAGWSPYAQFIVRGIILLAAVAFDEYQKSLRMKTKPR